MDIVISPLSTLPIEKQDVELVEHKGIGHPDSISDGVCEAASVALCRAYKEQFGAVLHHNVDKGLLIAGASAPRFGGGKIDKKIKLIICGRATSACQGKKIDVDSICIDAAKQWIEHNLNCAPSIFDISAEIKEGAGLYWKNHFSTIGIIGMNEACLNLMGVDIGTEDGLSFSLRVMDFIRRAISDLQDRTGELFNLEATPGEGTSYRLAMLDKGQFPQILCANEGAYNQGAAPYYTNSTQLPVDYTDDLFETLMHQDDLQSKYTGGTVLHLYLGEEVSDIETVKSLIGKVVNRFRLPYFTLTPTFSVCPSHGYLAGEQTYCPTCHEETEIYSRVVGYLRPIKQWNKGKQAEYKKRKVFRIQPVENEFGKRGLEASRVSPPERGLKKGILEGAL